MQISSLLVSDDPIHFPIAMPGLEECQQFQITHQPTTQAPVLYWLKSLDNPDVMLSVILPHLANIDYHFQLNDDEMAILQAKTAEEVLVLLPLYRTDKAEDAQVDAVNGVAINATLHAPILINPVTRLGMQKILHKSEISALIKEVV